MGERQVILLSSRERSESELRMELEEERRRRMGRWREYGYDGYITLEERVYEYRGVRFKVLKRSWYCFHSPDPLHPELARGERRVFYVLEPEGPKWQAWHEWLDHYGFDEEWLWWDTLRPGIEELPERDQLKAVLERAKEDIDWFYTALPNLLRLRIRDLEAKLEELEELRKEG
jgi:hypothetical protein